MEKLGPGSDADTLQVLAMIPTSRLSTIVDAGSGPGRQSIALAKALQTPIDAVDISDRHLGRLEHNARTRGIEHLIRTHCADMADIPSIFPQIDLLWSECAAYHIGFPNALRSWFKALRPGGYAIVSELSWLRNDVPDDVLSYFEASYPDMKSVDRNIEIALASGYELIGTHLLSKAAWTEQYYDLLAPLSTSLLDHPEQAVRNLAAETLKGIHIFDSSDGSFGYVFYVLKKPDPDCA